MREWFLTGGPGPELFLADRSAPIGRQGNLPEFWGVSSVAATLFLKKWASEANLSHPCADLSVRFIAPTKLRIASASGIHHSRCHWRLNSWLPVYLPNYTWPIEWNFTEGLCLAFVPETRFILVARKVTVDDGRVKSLVESNDTFTTWYRRDLACQFTRNKWENEGKGWARVSIFFNAIGCNTTVVSRESKKSGLSERKLFIEWQSNWHNECNFIWSNVEGAVWRALLPVANN